MIRPEFPHGKDWTTIRRWFEHVRSQISSVKRRHSDSSDKSLPPQGLDSRPICLILFFSFFDFDSTRVVRQKRP